VPGQFWYPQRVKKALCPALFLFLTVLTAAAVLLAAGPAPAQAPLPRNLAVVVIDPAHGGSDTGARGSGGTIESEVVVDFGRAIRVALEAQGFRAVLTREGNQNPSFDARAALVNGLPDAVFITLHVSSTGTPGTVHAYFCSILPAPAAASPPSPAATGRPAPPRRPAGLLEWDRAQEPYVELSRRLALLVQIQLALRFQGSPETPSSAPVRQLRTVAAPAIAIEVSNVSLDAARLSQMGQPLGEALARALSAFRQALAENASEQRPAR
jgi:N-acetylmuramoyl-L-alanine amidase